MESFESIVVEVLNENMTASGAMSVLGAGAAAGYSAQAQIPNGDTYAQGDARVVKPLYKKVIKRNMPKDSIFTGKVKSKKKKTRKTSRKKKK
jgi:hypothetical protein